jgi:hypothetical protein
MTIDLETWLIDTGDAVLHKLNNEGASALDPINWGVYWMWWIDYAVRNSGSFGPLQDMDSTAINDLLAFSERTGLQKSYLEHFDEACSELRDAYCRRTLTSISI